MLLTVSNSVTGPKNRSSLSVFQYLNAWFQSRYSTPLAIDISFEKDSIQNSWLLLYVWDKNVSQALELNAFLFQSF